jgi:hypothetical protein
MCCIHTMAPLLPVACRDLAAAATNTTLCLHYPSPAAEPTPHVCCTVSQPQNPSLCHGSKAQRLAWHCAMPSTAPPCCTLHPAFPPALHLKHHYPMRTLQKKPSRSTHHSQSAAQPNAAPSCSAAVFGSQTRHTASNQPPTVSLPANQSLLHPNPLAPVLLHSRSCPLICLSITLCAQHHHPAPS